jgi:formylglycine-generating enzyme required for sulfatase activity
MPFRLLATMPTYVLRAIAIAIACVSIAHAQQEQQPGLFESLGKLLQPQQEAKTADASSGARTLAVAGKDRRVALVIGNSAYPGAGALKNPANDANDIAAKLKKLGFDVTVRTDMRHKDMLRSLTEFGDKVQSGTEALFFYAGHGMQVRGKNYLLPIDAEIRNEASASSEAVDVDQLLDKLSLARLSVVILDACRNNPFERRFRGSGQGLAQINAPTGTLIAYATAPGKVAADGDGRNGLYTSELLTAMDIPGIKIEDVFKRVRGNVVKKSNDAQTPWESSSLTGDFYFTFQGPTTVNVLQAPADPEAETWAAAQGANTVAGYQTYLEAYPKGRYTHAAKIKLTDLQKPATSQSDRIPVVSAQTTVPALQEHGELQRSGMVFKDCEDCPEMVVIPAGSFRMGSNDGDSDEQPVHAVRIGSMFALGKTEVTQRQWRSVMGIGPQGCDDCPMEQVSWNEAQDYVGKLSQRTGKAYRLPSEAEWEYACRAGSTNTYCGSDSIDRVAWHDGNSDGKAKQVAGKQPNAFGLFDMSGNVWEWTGDCWNGNYGGAPPDGTRWASGDCTKRVLRGGSWGDAPKLVRAAVRSGGVGTLRYMSIGFRPVRMLLPIATSPAFTPAPVAASSSYENPEAAMWNEVRASGAREYLDAYLKQYPKGKYVALAKIELKKLDERDKAQRAKELTEKQQAAERERQETMRSEQAAWDEAKSAATAAAYASYLERYPRGRYASLAQVALPKLQREAVEREKLQTDRLRTETERQRLVSERKPTGTTGFLGGLRPGEVFKDCADCPEMVVIPAGNFEMGGSVSDDEKPVHRVTLKAFAMGKTEVTQGQWKTLMGSNPSNFKNCGDACPVENVTWNDAKEYIRKLNAKTGKTYRLPSEAEWEYTCRANETHMYCGGHNVASVGWYDGISLRTTHSVAGKQANAFGLHDMSGNVWEWVEDCWNDSYNGAPTDGSAWITGECSVGRVLRGGSWDYESKSARADYRNRSGPTYPNSSYGFRLARMIEQIPATKPKPTKSESASSGLEWAESDNGSDINWAEAKNYCASKGSGWRLPSVAELQSNYQSGQSTPCGSYTCKVASKSRLTGQWFWSNEPSGSSIALSVYLYDGTEGAFPVGVRNTLRALCMRRS